MLESIEALHERIRRLEAELRVKERLLGEADAREPRYRQLMESNMVGVLFWHVDGRMLDANDKVLEITGYDRTDLVQGKINWAAMTPPEYADREAEAHRQLAEQGVCAPFEKEYVRKDGSRVPILIGGAFLKGSREEGVCFLLDISQQRRMQQRLEASQRLFQAFADNDLIVAFIKDAQGRRVFLNRHYRECFCNGTDLLGKSDVDMYGPEIASRLAEADAAVLRTRSAKQSLLELPAPEGGRRTWLTYKFPVEGEQGESLVGGVALDVTDLKRAQEQLQEVNQDLERRVVERTEELQRANQQLRKSENRLRKWLEQSVVPIQVVSPQGWTVQVNPAWERLWGVEFKDTGAINLLSDAQVEEQGIGAHIRKALSGEVTYVPEVPYVPETGVYAGQARWCRGVIYPVKNDATGEVEEIVIIHDDVTERKAIEEKLREEERVLRNLLDLQEQERKLIAYEIHDGIVQDMIGAQMILDACRQSQSAGQEEPLGTAVGLLRKGIDEARRLISGLRPLVLDERGIITSIEYLIAEEQQRGGPEIHFFHRVQFTRLTPLVEGAVFRIIQECLRNALRHSGSDEVEVWMQQQGDWLKLLVRDYGCGFDARQVPKERFGLEGIRRRAQIFGGTASVESHPGEGTTVRVEIPLEVQSGG
jgi:PAS domain S-box-containing protein